MNCFFKNIVHENDTGRKQMHSHNLCKNFIAFAPTPKMCLQRNHIFDFQYLPENQPELTPGSSERRLDTSRTLFEISNIFNNILTNNSKI